MPQSPYLENGGNCTSSQSYYEDETIFIKCLKQYLVHSKCIVCVEKKIDHMRQTPILLPKLTVEKRLFCKPQ